MNLIQRFGKSLARLGNSLSEPKAGYVGGQLNRMNSAWRPYNRTADAEIRKNYELLTARARWLGRNNPWCIQAGETWVDNLIGEGIKTFAAVKDDKGKLVEDWNKLADESFKYWMDQADLAGRMHWYQMTRTCLFQCIETGDGIMVETAVNEPGRVAPMAYQLIEPDQIDCSRDRPAGENSNRIERGIEFDDYGRRVAYYILSNHPGSTFSTFSRSERVPASRVIHLFRAKRASQTRGVSWYAPIVTTLWDSYEYMQHEISAAKIQSFFVYMLKRDQGADAGFGFTDENMEDTPVDEFGNKQAPLGPGIGLYGGPNDSLDVIQSARPNGNAVPWLKFMLQMMGQGVGLSYPRFTGDFSETNFSSARAADLQDRKRFIPAQAWHAYYVDTEVRRRVTRQTILLGDLPIPSGGVTRFQRNEAKWLATKYRAPGWKYVDPQKQVEASKAAIGAGLSTWEIELSEIGEDRDEVFSQLADEIKLAKSLGIPLENVFQPITKPASSSSQNQNQDQPTQQEAA